MTIYTKICVALFGVAVGFIVLFAIDMVLNSGKFIAHAVHSKTPECSGACHGQNSQGSAAVLVLPPMPTTHRLSPAESGARRDSLLGVSVETQRSD